MLTASDIAQLTKELDHLEAEVASLAANVAQVEASHRDPDLPHWLLNRAADPPDVAAQIAAARASALGETYRGAMAPFREALLNSASPEDAMRSLKRIYSKWRPARLQGELEEALQLCAAHGAAKGIPR